MLHIETSPGGDLIEFSDGPMDEEALVAAMEVLMGVGMRAPCGDYERRTLACRLFGEVLRLRGERVVVRGETPTLRYTLERAP